MYSIGDVDFAALQTQWSERATSAFCLNLWFSVMLSRKLSVCILCKNLRMRAFCENSQVFFPTTGHNTRNGKKMYGKSYLNKQPQHYANSFIGN